MRRKVCAFLTLLMVLGCGIPTLAASETSSSLYEQYGSWHTWSQEQRESAEANWSEEEWEQYWLDYQNWAWLPMEQYYLDNDTWYASHYNIEDTDWTDYLIAEKQEMGMPYPNGINVSLNGVYLDFDGLQPIAADGRVLVPFRSMLEASGAQVAYQNGTVTATTADGDTITVSLEDTVLSYTMGKQLGQAAMGDAPTIIDGHIYVPVRAAAEALGLDVYWDETYESVYLTDWDALTAEIDCHFSCFNELIAAATASVDWEKTYSSTGNLTLTGTLYGEKENDSASLALDISSLQSKSGMSTDMTLDMDLGQLENTIFSALPPEVLESLRGIDNGSISLILNNQKGAVYFQGTGLSQLNVGMTDGQWMGIQLTDEQQVSLQQLMTGNQSLTLGMLLTNQQKNIDWYYRQSPWEAAVSSTLPLRLFLGDENFTRKESGTTVTYSAHTDLLTLNNRLEELGMDSDSVSITDFLTGQAHVPDVNMDLTAKTIEGKLQTIQCTGRLEVPSSVPLSINFELSGTPLKSAFHLEFKGAYVGKFTLEASSTASVTTRTVPTAPPEYETIQWMN